MLMDIEVNDKLGAAIDRTLQYYAFFRYPLQAAEIRQSCPLPCSEEAVQCHLERMLDRGAVFTAQGYYSSSPDISELLRRRLDGNARAAADIARAKRAGRIIYQFPFVSFVGISGSLSKGYSDAQADFDFFIVTRRDRLWISRTVLHLFKKLTFAVGAQHRFCMNYFIDESALPLEERNIYTATELSSLLPVCGTETYRALMQANAWVRQALPNFGHAEAAGMYDEAHWLKRGSAALLNRLRPAALNGFLMRLTDVKWRRKWSRKGFPAEDYDLAFKTTLHISKNHRANYQKRILEALDRKEA